MSREEITNKILNAKRVNRFKWADVADLIGQSKEWTACAFLGQLSLSEDQVKKGSSAIGISFTDEEIALLTSVPHRGSLASEIPTDPLIYRFYEITQVFGVSIKSLIEEEFGDGIMSAIDFEMKIERQHDPNGDRVNINMSGKFLPYKSY